MLTLYGSGAASATGVRQAADLTGQGAPGRDDRPPQPVVPAEAGTRFPRAWTQNLGPRLRGGDGFAAAGDWRLIVRLLFPWAWTQNLGPRLRGGDGFAAAGDWPLIVRLL